MKTGRHSVAQVIVGTFRQEYNRPHSVLCYLMLVELAREYCQKYQVKVVKQPAEKADTNSFILARWC